MQMANFALLGILLFGLAVALYRTARRGWPAHIAPVLMGITGVGFLMSVAPTDHGPPGAPETWHGDIHSVDQVAFYLTLLVLFVGITVIARHTRSLAEIT